jgi:hypothetical protein
MPTAFTPLMDSHRHLNPERDILPKAFTPLMDSRRHLNPQRDITKSIHTTDSIAVTSIQSEDISKTIHSTAPVTHIQSAQ